MKDLFDESREEMGADFVDAFLAKFGMGPKYVPAEQKKESCPKCGSKSAFYKEIHTDTSMNDIVLHCPDCKFLDE